MTRRYYDNRLYEKINVFRVPFFGYQKELLSSKTIEMRLFERCFLVKMQGKAAAASMDGIDMLLRDTFSEISILCGRYKELKVNLSR